MKSGKLPVEFGPCARRGEHLAVGVGITVGRVVVAGNAMVEKREVGVPVSLVTVKSTVKTITQRIQHLRTQTRRLVLISIARQIFEQSLADHVWQAVRRGNSEIECVALSSYGMVEPYLRPDELE